MQAAVLEQWAGIAPLVVGKEWVSRGQCLWNRETGSNILNNEFQVLKKWFMCFDVTVQTAAVTVPK